MNNTTKIALVTGGSRGLGKDMALRLAEKGLNVILTYNNRADDAQRVVAQIEAAGRKAAALQLNTGAIQSFGTFADRLSTVLTERFGADHIDFLVNNAGQGGYCPIPEVTEVFFDD
jgi:NAD(P)-dependent dehydrogenase (short-subunit alcohol dehydrogenase family)